MEELSQQLPSLLRQIEEARAAAAARAAEDGVAHARIMELQARGRPSVPPLMSHSFSPQIRARHLQITLYMLQRTTPCCSV